MCGADGIIDPSEPHHQEQLATLDSFPKELYASLTDAHCHIQDDRVNIQKLVQSWSASRNDVSAEETDSKNQNCPQVSPLHTSRVCLMGVQPSHDLGLAAVEDKKNNDNSGGLSKITDNVSSSLSLNANTISTSSTPVVTVTWNETDTKGDWDLVSKLAHDHPDRFVPCFGIHPWFTHKYRPLEEPTGPALELRGHAGSSGTATATAALAGTGSSPALSFSSAAVTSVPDSGIDREAFLAMSKQLQDQMAKDKSQSGKGIEQDRQDKDSITLAAVAPVTDDKVQGVTVEPESIQLSTSEQHRHSRVSSLEHYKQVLSLPTSAPESYLQELSTRLPEPRALEPAMTELRRKLEEHPHAILGEIGLDRTARVPEPSTGPIVNKLDDATAATVGPEDKDKREPQKKITLALTSIQHQLDIVREQLKIAASLDRAVSFHCVQAYGHWHDFLIREGRRLRQMEAEQTFYLQMQQIHGSNGGDGNGSPLSAPLISPTTGRLSKRGAARLRREARDAEWERHVASTLQESSDEESDDDEDGPTSTFGSSPVTAATIGSTVDDSTLAATAPAPIPQPVAYEPILPPRLCMHSYGGSVDMLRAFTRMDHPPEMYFSFSILINGRLQERKLNELILAVPEDRLLIESDHHSHAEVDVLLIEMVQKIATIRNWTVKKTVEITAQNWQRFVYG